MIIQDWDCVAYGNAYATHHRDEVSEYNQIMAKLRLYMLLKEYISLFMLLKEYISLFKCRCRILYFYAVSLKIMTCDGQKIYFKAV